LDNIPIHLHWIDTELYRCGQQRYLDGIFTGMTDSIPRILGRVKST